MRELGLGATDIRVRVSDRRLLGGILGELGLDQEQRVLAFQALDKTGRSEYQARRTALAAAGVGDAALARLESLPGIRTWADLEREFPHATREGEPLRAVFEALEAMGLGAFLDLDLTIVRGLAYYTGTVFELFDAGRSLRAICGGGRYDNLLAALGGVDQPALGFGMGDVVLTELLRERGLLPAPPPSADVFVASVTAEDRPHVLALAHRLRDAGFRVEYPFGQQALGKQFKLADARRVKVVVVVGPDDRARGQVAVKDLARGTQEAVAPERLEQVLGQLGCVTV